MKEIAPLEFKKVKEDSSTFVIDVREEWEYDTVNVGGLLMPLPTILKNEALEAIQKIPQESSAKIVFICHHGRRSLAAIKVLEEKHNMKNLYNLTGGIDRYAKEADVSLPTY